MKSMDSLCACGQMGGGVGSMIGLSIWSGEGSSKGLDGTTIGPLKKNQIFYIKCGANAIGRWNINDICIRANSL
jgi:hypothetical protein